jgi:ABC-type antimicrobial peptide transport system permease subunit
LRSAVRRAAPDVAVIFLGSGATLTGAFGAIVRVAIGVAWALACFALVLAMAGLFGVLSDVVSRRTREIGVRLALGADTRRIARMVFRDGLRPVVEGLLIGLGSAMVIRQLLRATYVEDMSAVDPAAFSAAAALLLAAGLAACYLPARRATRVEPNVALRDL